MPMSDSFADLWNLSAPSTCKKTNPQRLGSITPNPAPTSTHRNPPSDVFSLLASTSTRPSPAPPPPKQESRATAHGRSDAFSDLLSGTLQSNARAHMTMAQKAEQQRRDEQEKREKHLVVWEGLDNLHEHSSLSHHDSTIFATEYDLGLDNSNANNVFPSTFDDNGWDRVSSLSSTSHARDIPSQDDGRQMIWDLDEFAVTTIRASSSRQEEPFKNHVEPLAPSEVWGNKAMWDFDDLETTAHRTAASPSHNFDFGERKDWVGTSKNDSDEDNILGALSKPIGASTTMNAPPDHLKSPSNGEEATSSSMLSERVFTSSPPPHILGQLVEMGFSIPAAKRALQTTETGIDVQAALDSLLAAAANDVASPSREGASTARRQAWGDDLGQMPRRKNRGDRSGKAPSESFAQASQSYDSHESNIQDHADKILAQAGEIGLSVLNKASSLGVFNKATLFWKEGRERVQKVYEEQIGGNSSANSASGSGRKNGSTVAREARGDARPKWMQEALEWPDEEHTKKTRNGFKDDEDEHTPSAARKQKERFTTTETAVNLLGDEVSTAYVSPYRRRKPAENAPFASASAPTVDTRSPTSTPSPSSPLVRAPIATLQKAAKHKSAGSEAYKLGQFAVAEAAYTRGIDVLPAGHRRLIPLYNNRAQTRLKCGDYRGAGEDCTAVLEIIGSRWQTGAEALNVADGMDEEGRDVDMSEGLVKALKRRAEAAEGRERWKEAGADWEALAGHEWVQVQVRTEAVRGAGRCRRMQGAGDDVGAAGKAKPVVKRRHGAELPRNAGVSSALENLHLANAATEAEEQQRFALKDGVEARLLLWRGGKEANLRALLSSLDAVLWPELGMQKTSLADVVTPAQVKVRYMKTIGKIHPDKINPSNSTLEQRMLANGVFGTLNEAWNSFKP